MKEFKEIQTKSQSFTGGNIVTDWQKIAYKQGVIDGAKLAMKLFETKTKLEIEQLFKDYENS